jgi:hypothetical protein
VSVIASWHRSPGCVFNMPKGAEGSYNYGRIFQIGNRDVRYRYVNKDRKTKTLVDAKTKKIIQRSGMPLYDKKRKSGMPKYK